MNDSKQATVTIAEFLTARLDEAQAREHGKYRLVAHLAETRTCMEPDLIQVKRDSNDRWQTMERAEYLAEFFEPSPDTATLADIAAKRRMTERAWLSVQYLPPEMRTPAKDAAAYDAFWVLAELASVYSEHPDYRQEWKP